MRVTPDVKLAWPDALWDVEGVEQQTDHIGDHAQSEGC